MEAAVLHKRVAFEVAVEEVHYTALEVVLMEVLSHMGFRLAVLMEALMVVLSHMGFHLAVVLMEALMMVDRIDWEEVDSFRVEADAMVQKLGLDLAEEGHLRLQG